MSPRLLRWGLNLWPPYLGAGIHVCSIASDWSEAVVELRTGASTTAISGAPTSAAASTRWRTRSTRCCSCISWASNIWCGTRRRASSTWSPGRGTVSARFAGAAGDRVESIRAEASGGQKVLPEFAAEIRDGAGELVARVQKTVYVRLKPRYRPAASA